ncbi:MAG: hypothetical protein M0Z41_04305 [Peptococcaceae bacterium]|jgi:GrpB-like predicted nucleotidyltransferase (UPF0157 family)|nr:hypothetical protein [Peptococcaceae bacterium]
METSQGSLKDLTKQRDAIKAELAEIGDMRPGTLVPRFRKCGKPNCHCAKDGDPGHGPSWALTWKADGKTTARIIPSQAVERVKEQISEFRRFRELSRNLIEISEDLCDAKLETAKAEAQATAQKGASKTPSMRKSPKNSAPS